MVSKAEAWDQFWDAVAIVAVRQHVRRTAIDADRAAVERSAAVARSLGRASRAVSEARAAMKEVEDIVAASGFDQTYDDYVRSLEQSRRALNLLRRRWRDPNQPAE